MKTWAAKELKKGPPEEVKDYGMTRVRKTTNKEGRVVRIEYTRGTWKRVETYEGVLKIAGKEFIRKRTVKMWREQ